MFADEINIFYFCKEQVIFFQHRTVITAFGRRKKRKEKNLRKFLTHNENMQFLVCHEE